MDGKDLKVAKINAGYKIISTNVSDYDDNYTYDSTDVAIASSFISLENSSLFYPKRGFTEVIRRICSTKCISDNDAKNIRSNILSIVDFNNIDSRLAYADNDISYNDKEIRARVAKEVIIYICEIAVTYLCIDIAPIDIPKTIKECVDSVWSTEFK